MRFFAAASLLPLLFATPALAEGIEPTGRWTAFEEGQAALPPMGWNSWNAFYHDIDEDKLMAAATAIVDSGLAADGYRFSNIDDGWWLRRDTETGRMVIRTATFPSAAQADGTTSFRPLTDRLHAMGLKVGIYSDIGRNSCGQTFGHGAANNPQGNVEEREVGLYGHIDRDIALYFGEWGFDYIKVDGCGIRGKGADNANVAAGTYREFASGIGVLANSRLEVRNRGFARFEALVGLDDTSVATGTRARFEVYGDGVLLAQSDWIGFGEAAVPLAADVSPARIVELVVRGEGQGGSAPTTVWAEAALLR